MRTFIKVNIDLEYKRLGHYIKTTLQLEADLSSI